VVGHEGRGTVLGRKKTISNLFRKGKKALPREERGFRMGVSNGGGHLGVHNLHFLGGKGCRLIDMREKKDSRGRMAISAIVESHLFEGEGRELILRCV